MAQYSFEVTTVTLLHYLLSSFDGLSIKLLKDQFPLATGIFKIDQELLKNYIKVL